MFLCVIKCACGLCCAEGFPKTNVSTKSFGKASLFF